MSSSDVHAGYVLAINGESGSSDEAAIAAVRDRLRETGPVDRRDTSDPEELDELFDELDGRVLVVAGGDGSIHVAVARALACDALDRVTFGLIPMGTGNDLARTLGIPLDPEEAADALTRAAARRLDLVTYADGDVVVNAVHAGVGADAAERAQPMKEAVGKLAYPVGAVAAGVGADGWDVTVEVDGEVLAPTDGDRTLMVAVGNGCTIGGGTSICPDAKLDDGRLDVVVSRAVGVTKRAGYGTALLRGDHVARDDVATATGTQVTIRGDDIPYNVDGELVGSRSDVTFRVRPSAWSMLVP